MGQTARAALRAGGDVFGVIPEFLIPLEGVQAGADIRVTATMASRKAIMVEEADAFLVLPGGFGTLEEIFDMIRLRQVGRHKKPAGFVDTAFWAPLQTLMRHVVDSGFSDQSLLDSISFHDRPDEAVHALVNQLEAA